MPDHRACGQMLGEQAGEWTGRFSRVRMADVMIMGHIFFCVMIFPGGVAR